MLKCNKTKLTKGKITIEFYRKCLLCQNESLECRDTNIINCHIDNAEDGEISLHPAGFVALLLRTLAAGIVMEAGNAQQSQLETYRSLCHMSGFLVEEVDRLKEGNYQVKIHLPIPKTDIEA
jgi:hypothetical protein